MSKTLRVHQFGSVAGVQLDDFKAASQYVLDHIKADDFTPLVAKEFPLADFKAAFDQLAKNDLLGRVVLTMDK